jgi:hypothetical protein
MGDYERRSSGGGGGVSTIPFGNTLFVDAVNGNDSTALRGRQDKPFLGGKAAQNAAVSGDTIVILPGSYVDRSQWSNLGKDGVNWFAMPGAKISFDAYLSSPFSLFNVFCDAATVSGGHITSRAAMKYSVTGHLQVELTDSWGAQGNVAGIINVGHPGSDISITVDSLSVVDDGAEDTYGDYLSLVANYGARLHVNARLLSTVSAYGIWWAKGDTTISAASILSNVLAAAPSWAASIPIYAQFDGVSEYGQLWVRAQRIESSKSCIFFSGGTSAFRAWIECDSLISSSETAIQAQGTGGRVYVTAEKISGEQCLIAYGSPEIYITTQKATSTKDRWIWLTDSFAGKLFWRSAHLEDSGMSIADAASPIVIQGEYDIDLGRVVADPSHFGTGCSIVSDTGTERRFLKANIDVTGVDGLTEAGTGLIFSGCILSGASNHYLAAGAITTTGMVVTGTLGAGATVAGTVTAG